MFFAVKVYASSKKFSDINRRNYSMSGKKDKLKTEF